MKALILAAGRGSRLLSHTRHQPKCLLEIAGHSILDYQLAALRHCGIEEIVMVVGYCADRVKAHVRTPVTFVENPEYASTGSSHSLWLARDLVRDGFVYLNSDLIFHPMLLRRLLDHPAENGIIVDRRVDPASDMVKARMNGARILSTGKRLDAPDAELVGPARFGASGASRVLACLERLRGQSDGNCWVYDIFGRVAPEIGLMGIDGGDGFWAEIDTPAEARDANRRIPRELVEFVEAASSVAQEPAVSSALLCEKQA